MTRPWKLEAVRKDRDIKLEALADALDTSHTQVLRWQGGRGPQHAVFVIPKLARALNCTIQELWDGLMSDEERQLLAQLQQYPPDQRAHLAGYLNSILRKLPPSDAETPKKAKPAA